MRIKQAGKKHVRSVANTMSTAKNVINATSRYCLLLALLLSCSKSVLTVPEPIADVPVVVAEDKPIFHLGMPFEGGSVVGPVKSMAVWSPVVEQSKIVKANLKEKYAEYDSLFSENINRLREKLNNSDSQAIKFDKVDSMLKRVQKRLYEDSVFIATYKGKQKEEFYLYLIGLGIIVIAAILIAAYEFNKK